MRPFRPAAIFLSLYLVVAASCSAGKTGDPVAGAQCQQVLHAACTRAIDDCHLPGYPSTVDDCVSQTLPSCCGDSCDKKALSSQDDIAQCQRAITSAACDVFTAQGLPALCQHVVKY
jgi:hypothetical protein